MCGGCGYREERGETNGMIWGIWVKVTMRLRGKLGNKVVLREEEQGFDKRRGRGHGKVLLRSKCKTTKEDHMGRSDPTVTTSMIRPKIRLG